MSDLDELYQYVELVAERSMSSNPAQPIPQPNIATQTYVTRAAGHAQVGELAEGTRLRRIKGLLLRVLRVVTAPQVGFNTNTVAALQNLQDEVSTLRAQLQQSESRRAAESATSQTLLDAASASQTLLDAAFEELRKVHTDLTESVSRLHSDASALDIRITSRVDDLSVEHDALTTIIDSQRARVDGPSEHDRALSASIARLSERLESSALELQVLRTRVDLLLKEARRRLPEAFDDEQLKTFAAELAGRFEALYADFEHDFRGSRAEVRAKLEAHLPIITTSPRPDLPVVDVGCGRGEWLEILGSADVEAYGIDSSATFVEQGKARGLDMRFGDAIESLASLPPGSVRAISGIHIAEHLGFSNLVALIDTALGALAPGGPLLLETPNPTNVNVGAASFYLDPTHTKPLHPQLLEFLLTARGFVDVEIRYLNPAPEESQIRISHADTPGLERVEDLLNWAFFGPQDFLVLGWKPPGRNA